ncbi:MAG TPA: MMPL family transporter, partial [Thermoanaerobaculia bacterium]|nr:MMPL family transporter [Thermoanaerobaculia bacterium]
MGEIPTPSKPPPNQRAHVLARGGRLPRHLLRPAPGPDPPPWAGAALVLVLAAAAVAAVVLFVDLTPRVEGDFFFASDDPQLRAAARIEDLFPSRPQVLVAAVAEDPRSAATLERIRRLTAELAELDGVASVLSAASGPPSPEAAFEGPFWSRVLSPGQAPSGAPGGAPSGTAEGGAAGPRASFLILELAEGARTEALIPRLEAVLDAAEAPGFDLETSGVPYVVELIRRHLLRDLRVFTAAALALFGLLVLLLYRDLRIAAGILATCLTACAVSLLLLRLAGLTLGVLTANLVTIVFVLTLSHLVYLTANWRRLAASPPHRPVGAAPVPAGTGDDAVLAAIRVTGEASFWCMATTLLGFLSLLLASARPLRELGTAGALGTLVAFAAAYGLYPSFLRWASAAGDSARDGARPTARPRSASGGELPDPFGGRRLGRWAVAVAVLAAA